MSSNNISKSSKSNSKKSKSRGGRTPTPEMNRDDSQPNENVDWKDSFKQKKTDDGPRDGSHGIIQGKGDKDAGPMKRASTLVRAQKQISSQLDKYLNNIKRDVEAPIQIGIKEEIMKDINKAKRTLGQLQSRQISGQLTDQVKKKNKIMAELSKLQP